MSLLTRRGAMALLICALPTGCGDRAAFVDPGQAACRRVIVPDTTPARWSIVDDSSGRRVLDAYCAGVGPALLQPADSSAAPGDTLVLINWNMALGAGDLRALVHDLRSGHLAGFAPAAFVLLLQEAPRTSQHVPPASALPDAARASAFDAFTGADITTLAQELGLHLFYAPSMRNGLAAAEDQGNAILSSLPLRDPHALELPAGIRRRVAVAARVPWPGTHGIHVVSTHFDNWSLRHAPGSFGAIRARQARGLRAMLPPQDPLVVGGDLNTWARGTREPAVRILRRSLPRPPQMDRQATAVRMGVPRKLDYLLLRAPARWHFEERRVDHRYGSDHHPLVGLLFVPHAVPGDSVRS